MLAYQRVGSITILSFGDPGSLGTGGASPLRMKVEGVCMGFLDLLNSTSCQVRVTTNGTRGCFFWNIGLNHGMKTGDSLGMYLKTCQILVMSAHTDMICVYLLICIYLVII